MMSAILSAFGPVSVGSAVIATAASVEAITTPLRSVISPRAGSSGRVWVSCLAAIAPYVAESKPCSWSSRPAHSDSAIATAMNATCMRRDWSPAGSSGRAPDAVGPPPKPRHSGPDGARIRAGAVRAERSEPDRVPEQQTPAASALAPARCC